MCLFVRPYVVVRKTISCLEGIFHFFCFSKCFRQSLLKLVIPPFNRLSYNRDIIKNLFLFIKALITDWCKDQAIKKYISWWLTFALKEGLDSLCHILKSSFSRIRFNNKLSFFTRSDKKKKHGESLAKTNRQTFKLATNGQERRRWSEFRHWRCSIEQNASDKIKRIQS